MLKAGMRMKFKDRNMVVICKMMESAGCSLPLTPFQGGVNTVYAYSVIDAAMQVHYSITIILNYFGGN